MKNKKLLIIGIAVLLVLACLFVACTKKDGGGEEASGPLEALAAPQNVQVTDAIIRWDEVANAVGYILNINEAQYPTTSNMFDFTTTGLGKGNYIISVVAVGDRKKYTDSSASSAQLFEYQGATYTLNVIAEEGGTTSVSQKKYNANDVVDLVAYPKENYHFDGWFSDSFYKLSSSTDFSFNINSNTILYAQFSPNPEVLQKESEESSSLMQCSEDFAVVVYCPEADAESYISDHFYIYDDFFLDEEGEIAENEIRELYKGNADRVLEEIAQRKIGRIESRNNNLYVIYPEDNYQRSGSYVARATGNVSILKEYSRLVNDSSLAMAGEDLYLAAAEADSGVEELAFSIGNQQQKAEDEIKLKESVVIYSFRDNINVKQDNVDGWVLEKIGSGLSYDNDPETKEDEAREGGFTTKSIEYRRDGRKYNLAEGNIVGFGGGDENNPYDGITRDIEVSQITGRTVFGQVVEIRLLGHKDYEPIYYVKLAPVEDASKIFDMLDVYREGELDIGDYVVEHQEELTAKAMAMFTQSDDYHRFLATVATATESYAEENDLVLVGLTDTSSFLDKIKLYPEIRMDGSKFIFGLKGSVEIEFGKKDTKALKAGGKFTVSFDFKETLGFEYNFAWIKAHVIFFDIVKGINLSVITTQETDFVFDAAVVYSVTTQTKKDFIVNESTKKIHLPDCSWVHLMSEYNKRNTSETLVQLEKKGYEPCQHCLRSTYVLNTAKKCIHYNDCWHINQMLEINKFHSNRDMSELIQDGYHPCGTCLPTEKAEWKDYEATENFRTKISESLKRSNWGEKLKEIKRNYENADSVPDSTKDFPIIEDLPIPCVFVTIHLRVYLTLSFKIEASVHYEQHTSNWSEMNVRAAIGEKFHKDFQKDERANTKEFTLIGKVELKAGIKLEVSVSDPIGLVQLGVYGTCGVYADLAGVLHISNIGENYAAAYFEMGFYYDFGVTYRICYVIKGSLSVAKMIGLNGKIPFFKMGYSKVLYAYANDIEDTLLQASEGKKVFTLQEIGLMEVKNFTLPEMTMGTEVIDPNSTDYIVNLKLEKGQYLEIDGVNIRVKDNAPFGETFEDTLTISITSKEKFWDIFYEDKYILYLPTIQVKLTVANKCQEHVYLYLEEVEPTCTTKGYEECLMCSRCRKLFSVDRSMELSERKSVAALGHEIVILERVEPTCLFSGVDEGEMCSRCGEVFVAQEPIPADGHKGSEVWVTVKEATCESQGTECNYCAQCDAELDYRPILPAGHIPSTTTPGCLEEVTCTQCFKVLAAPRGHDYQSNTSREATCEVGGIVVYWCLDCGDNYTKDIAPLGHTDFETAYSLKIGEVTTAPTCTELGVYTYQCQKCENYYTGSIKALGHKFSTLWTEVDPTCTEPGKKSHICKNGCGQEIDVVILPALGHDWSEWVTINRVDCETDGSLKRVCNRDGCNNTETETIPATGHQWGELVTEENKYPTCTKSGESYRPCVACGKRQFVYPDALGHDPTPATCTEVSVCRRCGDKLTTEPLGHDFVEDSDLCRPATFEEDGYRHATCSRCGAEEDGTIPKLSHEWEESARKEATCSSEGYILYVCRVYHEEGVACAETYKETIAKTSHTLESVDEVPATCANQGMAAHRRCTGCGALFDMSDEKGEVEKEATCFEIAKNNDHDLVSQEAKEPTCFEAGWAEYYTCSRCEYKTYNEIPARHTWVDDLAVSAKCTETGLTAGIHCSVCGEILTAQKVTEALGHKYGSEVTPPTCIAGGYTTYTCTRYGCGDSYQADETAALGHDVISHEAKAATCTEKGWNAYETCSRCDYSTYEEIPAQKHSLIHIEAHDAGCFTDGNIAYSYCERCGTNFQPMTEEKHREYMDKTSYFDIMEAKKLNEDTKIPQYGDHQRDENGNLPQDTSQDSSCTSQGYIVYECKRCGYTERVEIATKKHNDDNENSGKGDGYCDECGCSMALTYEESGDGVIVIGYTSDLPTVVIPTWYNQKKVIGIKEGAFNDNDTITSVTIPDSVTTIGSSAFYGCTALTSVTIGNGVTTIGSSAFYGCTALTSVTIGNGVTTIGASAFYNCKSLTSITIPASVKEIGEKAFGHCENLQTFTIAEGSALTTIAEYAFRDCYHLAEIVIPASVTNIGTYAFYRCDDITLSVAPENAYYYGSASDSVIVKREGNVLIAGSNHTTNIPKTVEKIGDNAFLNCWDLITITIPVSVRIVGDWAFQGVSSLEIISFEGTSDDWSAITKGNGWSRGAGINTPNGTYTVQCLASGLEYTLSDDNKSYTVKTFGSCEDTDFIIPSTYEGKPVTAIGENAFKDYTSLKSITIPSSVTSIGKSAFNGCTSLRFVTIGSGVTSIGASAFYNCTALYQVNFGSDSHLTTIGASAFSGCTALTKIEIPEGVDRIEKDTFNGCTSLASVTIPDNVYLIGEHAFTHCTSLTSIDLPSALTQLKDYSFQRTGLTSIIIPGKDATIGKAAFHRCSDLTSITILDGVTTIGLGAFQECTALISVTISNSVMTIDNQAFYECTSLASVLIGSGVMSIGNNTFYNCHSLQMIEIPSGVTRLGSSAFRNCGSLQEITIPNGVTAISNYTFDGCSALTSVTIPSDVTSFGDSVFRNCSSLQAIEIPNGVMSIGTYAFYNCSSLKVITIPSNVTSIGAYTFWGCSVLQSVVLSANTTTIGTYAFFGCKGLTSITIPSTVTSIGDNAFYSCDKLVEVCDKSSLSITKGQTANGYVAYYALNVYTASGNSKLSTYGDGYVIYTVDNNTKYLMGYTGTEQALTLPSGITEIYKYAFYGRKDLRSVTISNSVEIVGAYAFCDCRGLTSVIIGTRVIIIRDDAFKGCYDLMEVRRYTNNSLLTPITPGATKYGYVAYYAKAVYTADYTSKVSIDEDGYILYTDTTADTKTLVGYVGSTKRLTLPSDITEINQYAFYGRKDLVSVMIPNSVTKIGDYAFYECRGLTSITIPNSVTTIGTEAFSDCDGLTSVTIPNSVTTLGNGAFSNCDKLAAVTLSTGVSSINEETFRNCVALASITIPNKVTTIGKNAFSGCKGLTEVTLGNGVTSIGSAAFKNCRNFTSITIPSSVTSIEDEAFDGCYMLVEIRTQSSSLEIAAGASTNGNVAYYAKAVYTSAYTSKVSVDANKYVLYTDGAVISLLGYRGIATALTLPAGITEINKYAFCECSSLTSVEIPVSVTRIGVNAFLGCSSLKTIQYPGDFAGWCGISTVAGLMQGGAENKSLYIGETEVTGDLVILDGVTSIGNSTFYGCKELTSVTIPASVTSIGAQAFSGCDKLAYMYFQGTETQWNAVEKAASWGDFVGSTTTAGKCWLICESDKSANSISFFLVGTHRITENESTASQKFLINMEDHFDVASMYQNYSKIMIDISFHVQEINNGYQDVWLAYSLTNEKVDGEAWYSAGKFHDRITVQTGGSSTGTSAGDWNSVNASALLSSYAKGTAAFDQLTTGTKTLYVVFGAHGQDADDWDLSNAKITVTFAK